MKINIGSGDVRIDGYINCDYDSSLKPDFVLDLEKDIYPFEDNTVETVIAHHILEHLGDGYFHCIQELYRICKNGAIVDIRVPHPRHDSFIADPTHRRPITPLGLQLFSKKFNEYCKKNNFASSRLADYYNVDYDVFEWHYIPEDKYKQFFAGKTNEFIEEYIHERNNIIKEYHIKLVVNKL